jgi:hypothetical protein
MNKITYFIALGMLVSIGLFAISVISDQKKKRETRKIDTHKSELRVEEPVNTLPFQQNCASMQQYFNTRNFNPPVKFSGFEAYSMAYYSNENNMTQAGCWAGYATETSPMGTRVCPADIAYTKLNDTGKISYRWTVRNRHLSPCRWQ